MIVDEETSEKTDHSIEGLPPGLDDKLKRLEDLESFFLRQSLDLEYRSQVAAEWICILTIIAVITVGCWLMI